MRHINTPRRGGKRGGGAAIVWKTEDVNIKKLNICIPPSVEAVWGICKPKSPKVIFREILLCSFYSPPDAGKNTKLIAHISEEIQRFLATKTDARVIVSGD